MSAAKRSFGLFLVGVLLAAFVAVSGSVFGNQSQDDKLAATNDLSEEADQFFTPEMKELVSSNLSTQQRVEILSQALHAGTIDSLQLFWPHFLSQIPEYETEVEPQVRYHALHALALKFERSDWEQWAKISSKAQEQSSSARIFVDDISVINPSLGRFLETSAYLFNKLYVATLKGKAFDEGAALQHLLQNADTLLNRRRISALPASLQVEPELLSDPQFYAVFEAVRGKLIASYIAQKTSDLDNQLALILSLSPKHLFPRAATAIEHVIYRIILQIDALQRIELLGPWEKLEALKVFSEDKGVRQALARLYLSVSLDLMEQGRKTEAGQLYSDATALGAHVSMQASVGDFIENGVVPPTTVAMVTPSAGDDSANGMLFGPSGNEVRQAIDTQVEAVEDVSVSIFFFVVIAFFAIVALMMVFFIARKVFSEQFSSADFDVVEPIDGPVVAASDGSKVKGFPSPAEIKRKRVNV